MWDIKTFETKYDMLEFIESGNYKWSFCFVDNAPYAIEYRKLRQYGN